MAENKIRVLPPEVVNKISAGEVVERPASVVKELIENSVDAGAQRITVEIKKGGSELIKVSDNGCGMSAPDARLCLHRHSTSKLRTAEDIERVATLGFRGEALPSIASVSRMSIKTRAADDETGIFIHADGGEASREEIIAPAAGTEITVEQLFFNTPARRKFLKSASTELAHISNIITSQALAGPGIHFELFHNGKLLIRAPRTNNPEDRVLDLFGAELKGHLISFEAEGGGAAVKGMLSGPEYSRTRNNCMFFFVNGRPVKSKLLNHAVLEACRPLIPGDRFPFISLFVHIDPAMVDVNIHPRKTEVKFLNPGGVHDLLGRTLREALNTGAGVPSVFKNAAGGDYNRQSRIFEAVHKYTSGDTAAAPAFNFLPARAGETPPDENINESSAARPLAQANSMYIISEDEAGLILIDQHAAHEKILYEKLRAQYERGGIPVQNLLSPCAVELSAKESAFVEENLELLEKSGFSAEPFGQNAFLVRTVPAALEKADPKRLFLDMASDLSEAGKPLEFEKMINGIICSAACHAAVKAGEKLEQEEMRWIVSALGGLSSPYSCPHGRPSMIRLEFSEIAKKFRRSP